MANNISNMLNSRMRFSGMASGLDTDTIVQQLLTVERSKIDRVKQDKQVLEWKRDDYRSITNQLRAFKDEFLNILKPSNNIMSQDFYKKYTASSSASEFVTATATSSAISGSHTMHVTALATAAKTSSGTIVSSELKSSASIADFNFSAGKTFTVNLNGTSKTITVSGDFSGAASPIEALKDNVQSSVDTAFGIGKITVGFSAIDDTISFSSSDGKVTLNGSTGSALEQMNITDGSSNRLRLTSKLDSTNLANPLSGTLQFNINGVDFSINTAEKTMQDVMNQINSSAANVTMSYSEVTDKFTLTAKNTGAGEAITITNSSGTLFGAGSSIGITSTSVNNGTDAEFDLDGVLGIKRSSNNFTIDGVSYSLKKEGGDSTITVAQDVNTAFDSIKSFITKYNELIDNLNNKISEERDRNYPPLTDEQKDSMSEGDIEKWEEKAKKGLLRNDRIVESIATKIRGAMMDNISGISDSLASIGISSSSYVDKGKLAIDETKLKAALEDNSTNVINIFTQRSTVNYSVDLSQADRTTRYGESGIAYRLSDVIEDNIRTFRDASGNKGLLLEKSGIIGDVSEFSNTISMEIRSKDTLIDKLLDKLYDKEDSYYKRFTAMEKAINQMNSQSSWLMQQMGS